MNKKDKIFIAISWILLILFLGIWGGHYYFAHKHITQIYSTLIKTSQFLLYKMDPLDFQKISNTLKKASTIDPRKKLAWELQLITQARWQILFGKPKEQWEEYIKKLSETKAKYSNDYIYLEAKALNALNLEGKERLNALYIIQKALAIYPNNKDLRASRALILLELGFPNLALKELKGLSTPYAALVCASTALFLGDLKSLNKCLKTIKNNSLTSLILKCKQSTTSFPSMQFFNSLCKNKLPTKTQGIPTFLLMYSAKKALKINPKQGLNYLTLIEKKIIKKSKNLNLLKAKLLLAYGNIGEALEILEQGTLLYDLVQKVLYPCKTYSKKFNKNNELKYISNLLNIGCDAQPNLNIKQPLSIWLKEQLQKIKTFPIEIQTIGKYTLGKIILYKCFFKGRFWESNNNLLKLLNNLSISQDSFLGIIINSYKYWCKGNIIEAKDQIRKACFAGSNKDMIGCPTPWGGLDLYLTYINSNLDEEYLPENIDEILTTIIDLKPKLPKNISLYAQAKLAKLQILYFPSSVDRIVKQISSQLNNDFNNKPYWLKKEVIPILVIGNLFGKHGYPTLKELIEKDLFNLSPEGIYYLALYLHRLGDYKNAIKVLNKAEFIIPKLNQYIIDKIYQLKGSLLFNIKAFEQSLEAFNKANQLTQQEKPLYAMALAYKGNCKRAINIVEKNINNQNWLETIINCYIICNKKDKAIRLFKNKGNYLNLKAKQKIYKQLKAKSWINK